MNPLPDNNRIALRQVARQCRKAALSTLLADGSGMPYASLVTIAFDQMLNPLLLLSGIADHSKNLSADPRVSLLLDGTDGHPNPQTGPRVSLQGRAERCDDATLRRRFLARHPGAALYAGFGDFQIWRIMAERAHFVGGFGRAVWFDAPFGIPATELAVQEIPLIETIQPKAAPLLEKMTGAAGWTIIALDCDGFEIMQGDNNFRRIEFAKPIVNANEVEQAVFIALQY